MRCQVARLLAAAHQAVCPPGARKYSTAFSPHGRTAMCRRPSGAASAVRQAKAASSASPTSMHRREQQAPAPIEHTGSRSRPNSAVSRARQMVSPNSAR
jgi:hypothetical protein